MKRVVVNVNEVGLVVKNKALVRVLKAGKYWLMFGETCNIYDLSKPFQTNFDIDVLLTTPGFEDLVDVVDVGDNEICLVFVNNNFKQVLAAGRHVFWKGLQNYRFQKEDISNMEIAETVNKQLLDKQVLAFYVRQYKVEPSEKALLFVDGEFAKILTPGTYSWWKNSTDLVISKVDTRLTTLEIVGQEILTKDKAQIRINFSVQYQVVDVLKALLDNKEFEKQLYMLMQLALRAYIGQMTLDELMENKLAISEHVLMETKEQVELLGVKIYNSGVKDVILPGDIREIMNQVLVAEKRAQANIITRREETASMRSLLNTAKLMEENATLMKLKEMEYIEKIADKVGEISISGGSNVLNELKTMFSK